MAKTVVAKTVVALDVGEVRIGVARGEVGSLFAFGRGVVTRTQLSEDVEAVQARVEAEGAAYVVVGLPSRLKGGDSAQTGRVRAFAAALERAGLRVVFEDERFTSRIASQRIASSGRRKKQRQEKGRVDEGAAVLILETHLAKARALFPKGETALDTESASDETTNEQDASGIDIHTPNANIVDTSE